MKKLILIIVVGMFTSCTTTDDEWNVKPIYIKESPTNNIPVSLVGSGGR